MMHKGKLWFADWRDHTGTRLRKGFNSKMQALRYQTKMRSDVTAKKAQRSGPSANSPKRGVKARAATKTATRRPRARAAAGRS